MEYISELMEFLDGSLTSYHAIQNVRRLLLREGYAELSEREIWKLEAGGKYFVVRNDSSMMAFCLPTDSVDKIKGYHVYAAHSDSPAFKIKESPEMEKEGVYVSMNTEKYGGMILSTWFDRPLVIAGRVCVENEGALETYPVQLKENTCMIPSLAIHMNREANSGMAFSAQNDMAPLLGMTGNGDTSSKGMIKAMLAETLNDMTGGDYRAEDILSYDLFVENCEKAVLAGMENEFIMTPRYDDLACVFAGCKGIMHARPERYIDVLAIFDNEEVGSLTRQGADSTFCGIHCKI